MTDLEVLQATRHSLKEQLSVVPDRRTQLENQLENLNEQILAARVEAYKSDTQPDVNFQDLQDQHKRAISELVDIGREAHALSQALQELDEEIEEINLIRENNAHEFIEDRTEGFLDELQTPLIKMMARLQCLTMLKNRTNRGQTDPKAVISKFVHLHLAEIDRATPVVLRSLERQAENHETFNANKQLP